MDTSRIPLELYRPIFEELVMQQWTSQSLQGRLVNRMHIPNSCHLFDQLFTAL